MQQWLWLDQFQSTKFSAAKWVIIHTEQKAIPLHRASQFKKNDQKNALSNCCLGDGMGFKSIPIMWNALEIPFEDVMAGVNYSVYEQRFFFFLFCLSVTEKFCLPQQLQPKLYQSVSQLNQCWNHHRTHPMTNGPDDSLKADKKKWNEMNPTFIGSSGSALCTVLRLEIQR